MSMNIAIYGLPQATISRYSQRVVSCPSCNARRKKPCKTQPSGLVCKPRFRAGISFLQLIGTSAVKRELGSLAPRLALADAEPVLAGLEDYGPYDD
jgi:hypothetical protein